MSARHPLVVSLGPANSYEKDELQLGSLGIFFYRAVWYIPGLLISLCGQWLIVRGEAQAWSLSSVGVTTHQSYLEVVLVSQPDAPTWFLKQPTHPPRITYVFPDLKIYVLYCVTSRPETDFGASLFPTQTRTHSPPKIAVAALQ